MGVLLGFSVAALGFTDPERTQLLSKCTLLLMGDT